MTMLFVLNWSNKAIIIQHIIIDFIIQASQRPKILKKKKKEKENKHTQTLKLYEIGDPLLKSKSYIKEKLIAVDFINWYLKMHFIY